MHMLSGTPPSPPDASHPVSLSSPPQISNRHWMRLEITATPTKHSPKLFLIDNEKRYFPTPISIWWGRHSWMRNPAHPAQLFATVPATAGQSSASTRQLSDSPLTISNRHKTTFFQTPDPLQLAISNRNFQLLEIPVTRRKHSPRHKSNRNFRST